MKLRTLRALHVATDALLVSIGWLAAYGLRYALAEPIGRAINPFDWYPRALPSVDPSSTINSSKSAKLWASTLSIALAR